MKEGDIVEYNGYFDECNGFKYRITYVYKDFFDKDTWYDLESIKPDILTHYTIIYSAWIHELKLINK